MKRLACLIIFLLTLTAFSFAQSDEFQPSYQINKAKATIHYFLSNFEKNPRVPKGVISMFSRDGFDLSYPWGEYKTEKEVEKWINEIPSEFQDAHHIQNIKVEIVNDRAVKAVVDVKWQNLGPDNKSDRDHFIYVFELIDEGIGLLKIKSIKCVRID